MPKNKPSASAMKKARSNMRLQPIKGRKRAPTLGQKVTRARKARRSY